MSIAGAVGFVVLCIVEYYVAITPGVAPVTPLNLLMVIGVYILGILLYLAAKAIRNRQGMDIGLAFKEIPPE